jgi:hypothetical protein
MDEGYMPSWERVARRAPSGSAADDLDLDARRLDLFPIISASDAPEMAALVLRPDDVHALGQHRRRGGRPTGVHREFGLGMRAGDPDEEVALVRVRGIKLLEVVARVSVTFNQAVNLVRVSSQSAVADEEQPRLAVDRPDATVVHSELDEPAHRFDESRIRLAGVEFALEAHHVMPLKHGEEFGCAPNDRLDFGQRAGPDRPDSEVPAA